MARPNGTADKATGEAIAKELSAGDAGAILHCKIRLDFFVQRNIFQPYRL